MSECSLGNPMLYSFQDVSLSKYGHYTLLEYFIIDLIVDLYSLVENVFINVNKITYNNFHN